MPVLEPHNATQDLAELDAMFRVAVDHPVRRRWLEDADLAYQFRQGEQWSNAELQVLSERNQPPIVENEIHAVIERRKGEYKRLRTTVKYTGRNAPLDEQTAQNQSDLHRFIDYDNDYEFEEGEVVDDGLVGGRGVLYCAIAKNELGQPAVRLRHEDPFCIFPDPYSRRYDWNEDARYICRSKWLELDDAIALWPNKKTELTNAVNGGFQPATGVSGILDPKVLDTQNFLYYDQQRTRVRPVEVWFKKRIRQQFLVTDNGIEVRIDDLKLAADAKPPANLLEMRVVDRMHFAVFCGGLWIVEPRESPYRCNRFPFVPYYAYRKKDGQPYGYVWNLIDPQREINARRSKALHNLNSRQTLYEKNAVKDKVELAAEMARADGQIEVENGALSNGKFQIRENHDITQGNLAMLQESKVAVRRIAGEDFLEPTGEMRSGAGVQRQQMPHQMGVVSLHENVRRTRRLKERLVYEYVKQFYTDEMVFQITDDPNVVRQVRLTAEHFAAIKEGIYDLVLDDQTDYATVQEQQFDTLATTLPQVIQFGPAWAKVLIAMSKLRNKDGLLQMIDQMSAKAPPEPKFSVSFDWKELTPEEKAVIGPHLGMPELAQVEMMTGEEPASKRKVRADLLKTKIKEGMRASIEEGRQNLAAQQTMVEGVLGSRQMAQDDTAMRRADALAELQQRREMQQWAMDREAGQAANAGNPDQA